MRNRIERLRLWLLAGAGLLVLVLAVFIGSARYLKRHVVAHLTAKLGLNIKSETNDVTLSHTSKGGTVYKLRAKKEDELTDGKIAFMDAQIMLYGPKQNRADRIYGDEFQYDESAGLLRAIGLVHIDMQSGAPAGDAKTAAGAARTDGKDNGSAAAGGKGDPDAKVLHATTSGLVYMEKLSVAATSERVEFQMGAMSGHAVGADYSSDSDVLSLHSEVYVSGTERGRPVELTAATAEIDNRDHVTYLTHAKYVSLGQTVEADQATVHTRLDGTVERIQAQGNVRSEENGARVACAHGNVLLNGMGQPESALMTGGVTYSSDEPMRQRRGQSDTAAITFDGQAQPQPQHAVFTGAVRMTERAGTQRAGAAGAGAASVGAGAQREPWSTRELTAGRVEVALVPAGTGKSEPRDAEASESAHLTVVSNGGPAKGTSKTELSADDLKAHFVEATVDLKGRRGTKSHRPQTEIETLAGRGHTLLHQIGADGVEQTSAGDTLDARFRPGGLKQEAGRTAFVDEVAAGAGAGGVAGAAKGRRTTDLLVSAVQQGHVHVVRRAPAKSKPNAAGAGGAAASGVNSKDDLEDAVASRAEYDGDLDRMTLIDDARLSENGSVIWARRIALDHATGNAQADGSVKMDYVQDDSAGAGGAGGLKAGASAGGQAKQGDAREPAHILADRAELNHSAEVGTFYGRPARLWQGGSQIQAPVIEFAREQRRLLARSDAGAPDSAEEVHTLLVSAGSDAPAGEKTAAKKQTNESGSEGGTCKPGAAGARTGGSALLSGAPGGAGAHPPQVARIASHELSYSDQTRQAEFSGGVKVQSADGTMLAREATAFLLKPETGGGAAGGDAGGEASGGISIDGRIDRVVAAGKVDIEQPGLHATGGGLLYTASDGVYVLTGENGVLPKVVDARGATTAVAFRFSSVDCGVEALNAAPGEKGPGQRVHTATTVLETKKASHSGR